MLRYAVCGGSHGVYDVAVIEVRDKKEAYEYALNLALEIIESSHDIYEALNEEVVNCIEDDMTEDEIEKIRYEIYEENADISYILIDESVASQYSTEELDSMCFDMTYEDFVKEYCIKR